MTSPPKDTPQDLTITPGNGQDDNTQSPQKIPIAGRFDQYRSSFWAGAIALLPLRYLARPFNRHTWEKNPNASFFDKHKYSGLAGAVMYGMTGYYALKTWQDMRNVLAEPLAWEFNKDPKDVGFGDFWRSKNTIVQQTISNFTKYNSRRFAVNTAFFAPFLFKGTFQRHDLHPETGVDLGVGANAAYLFSDVMTRRMSSFEEVQNMIDQKVNHAEHYSAEITGSDLIDIYERNAAASGNKSFLARQGTPAWENVTAFFDRMADLMNQTYKNTVPKGKANFGFPQLIYLIGQSLIDPQQLERSRAYIEIANEYGIPEVQKAQAQLARGVTLEKVMEQYPIHTPAVSAQPMEAAPPPHAKAGEGFVRRMNLADPAQDPEFAARLLKEADPANVSNTRLGP